MESVQVLISTYNGGKYLDEQIQSLVNQIGVNISILVRDDGSTDNTSEILSEWQKKGVLQWYEGDNLKPAKSFWDLVKNSSNIDYYAFCDQDDVWDENKLKIAIRELKKYDINKPTLYYSRLNPVDENLNPIRYNYKKGKGSLGKSMIICTEAGCTMVFNKSLMDVVRNYTPNFLRMHDHWIYLICMAMDYKIIYDQISHIKYRQHKSNTVGIKAGVFKQVARLWDSYNRGYSERWKQIKELSEAYSKIIPDDNLKLINKVVNYKKSWKNKMILIFDKDIKCHSIKKDIMLIIAITTGKF